MTGLSETLRSLRKQKNLTQKALADKMEVSVNTIVTIERSGAHHSVDMFVTFCEALEIEPWKVLRHVTRTLGTGVTD